MRTSMIQRYGLSQGLRKAALALCCAVFISAAGPAPHPRLLVLGDSLTAGYGLPTQDGFQAQLAARFPDLVLIDAAVSGDTSAGGLARLDWALADGADAAIVELGGNDALRGIDPAEMGANLTAILDDLQKRHIPVLLSGMQAPQNYGQDYATRFNAVFETLGHRPGVIYDPFFLQGLLDKPNLFQADHLHPNREGVAFEVARLAPLITALLARITPAS